MLPEQKLINLANSLDRLGFKVLAGRVASILKVAINPQIETLRKELMSEENPLPRLRVLYSEALNNAENQLVELFNGDRKRARDFLARNPSDLEISPSEEAGLAEEFGQEKVNYYVFGIGNKDVNIVESDVQHLVLELLESHRSLARNKNKKRIKEIFDIYTY